MLLYYSLDLQTEAVNLLAESALACAQEAENGRGNEIASNLLLSLSKKIGFSSQSELINLMKTLSLSVDNLPLGRLLQWCTTVADTRKLTEWDINIPGQLSNFIIITVYLFMFIQYSIA